MVNDHIDGMFKVYIPPSEFCGPQRFLDEDLV